jgi:hypothetical protein
VPDKQFVTEIICSNIDGVIGKYRMFYKDELHHHVLFHEIKEARARGNMEYIYIYMEF